MKIEEIEKLCARTSPGPWSLIVLPNGKHHVHISGSVYATMDVAEHLRRNQSEIDGRFMVEARTLLPKLLAVAKAAREHEQVCEDTCTTLMALQDALEDLERE